MPEKDYGYHLSVMKEECLKYLNVEKDKLYFDGTLGGGGHSLEILKRGGRLIATDLDDDALDYAENLFNKDGALSGRFKLVKSNFKNVLQVLSSLNESALDGAILDLGISSHQIDQAERGFSYMKDGSLDMRMDQSQALSAAQIVNEYDESEIADIIFTYGEDSFGRRIARRIVEERKKSPIITTSDLSRIIASAVPFLPKAGHPAKKTFQALRIFVNSELTGLKEAVTDIVSVLNKGARLAVITFHSLEDRIIKQTFKLLSTDCICDKSLPVCVCGHRAEVKLTVSKGIRPSESEQQQNSRSKSATLRVIEKL